MAYNGDNGMIKRPRMESDSQQRNHNDQFNNYSEDMRRKRPENEKPNHVLLFTVINPLYPITVDVLHTICSPIGEVLRIVIFKKNGVQAMVEFDSIETAKRARENLNGADIYSGCCTLKIEYSKTPKLNVRKNNMESWDYTNPPISKPQEGGGNRPAPLLQEPRFGAGPQPFRGDMRGGPGSFHDEYDDGPGYDQYERFPPGPMDGRFMMKPPGPPGREPLHAGPPPRGPGYGLPLGHIPPNGTQGGGAVMMVYGLDPEKVNCDKLFNLFCLYGNVVRVKFLKTKEGCAMVQMGDAISVERCVSNLNNVSVGGYFKMQLGFSKQAFLSDVAQPYSLSDKSPSFKDFTGNKNNRFINPSMAMKNRIQGPSKVLHFFNTPPSLTEDQLLDVFAEKIDTKPNIQIFPMKGDRSSSGLLEFDSEETAMEALMLCNHLLIKHPGGKAPYTMKLCFSSNRYPVIKKKNAESNIVDDEDLE